MNNNNMTIEEFFGVLITGLVLSGRKGTAMAYTSAVRKARLIMGKHISFSTLFSLEGLCLCERCMHDSGLNNNTISFYMRTLRTIYYQGVAMGVCVSYPHLFAGVCTSIGRTSKRAIPPEIFGVLQKLDLSGKENLAFARDMFLLSYSLQGISFVDLAHLRKSNIKGKLLTYRRAKTGTSVTVALSDVAREIITQYAASTEGSPYLLPIIKNPDGDTHLQQRSALRTYNRRLKKLAWMANIEETLTSYTARHTWATAARHSGVPMGVISQGMGHQTEKTTHVYLSDFNYSVLLEANEKVLMAANLVCRSKSDDKNSTCVNEEDVSLFKRERHFRMQT